MRHSSIALAWAAALTLTGCSKSEEKNTHEVVDETPIVEVARVHKQDVENKQSYTANVEAFNENNISPASPNRIKSIRVDVGDHVRRGQTLVTLDRSQATQLKVNMDQVEREYNRAVQLLKIGSGTQAQVDQLKAQLDAQRAQYGNVIENTSLTSPVSGVVTARNYDPGDVTGQLPVLTVGQISPNVKVVINITETDRTKVAKGQKVEVEFDAFPGETFQGTISRVYPQVDPTTRTFQAEVVIPNPSEKFFPGMFARVSLSHGTNLNVVVPDRAVVKQTGSGNRYVYVYKNGQVSYNKVELGQRIGTAYEVLQGVNDGDSVVISGQSRLADGVAAKLK